MPRYFQASLLLQSLVFRPKICRFLLVFCSCFVPLFAIGLLRYCCDIDTLLARFWFTHSVTLLGASCEPLERLLSSFLPPHISRLSHGFLTAFSRLSHGFSCVLLGLNAPHSLWSSFARFNLVATLSTADPPLHHHQNHIKTSSKVACILLAF